MAIRFGFSARNVTDRLSLLQNLPAFTAFTMAAWMRIEGVQGPGAGNLSAILSLQAAATTECTLITQQNSAGTSPGFGIITSAGVGPKIFPQLAGVWRYCAIASGGYFFIDGQEFLGGIADSGTTARIDIGTWTLFTGSPNCSIAEVRIWSANLGRGELLRERVSRRPVRQTDLIGWYPMYAKKSATFDFSGHGNTLVASSIDLPNTCSVQHPVQLFEYESGFNEPRLSWPATVYDLARVRLRPANAAPPATGIVFRKTLSGIGSRGGSRQTHGWG